MSSEWLNLIGSNILSLMHRIIYFNHVDMVFPNPIDLKVIFG